ncbi:unnamed protein product [Durusdinium trenchii]|uniref:Uncharacterized protein n=1 Tax=Durusdinium trenchii TaxID=1381693 RepID=A0ABP0P2H2_9DINO
MEQPSEEGVDQPVPGQTSFWSVHDTFRSGLRDEESTSRMSDRSSSLPAPTSSGTGPSAKAAPKQKAQQAMQLQMRQLELKQLELQVKLKRRLEQQAKDAKQALSAKQQQLERQRQHAFLEARERKRGLPQKTQKEQATGHDFPPPGGRMRAGRSRSASSRSRASEPAEELVQDSDPEESEREDRARRIEKERERKAWKALQEEHAEQREAAAREEAARKEQAARKIQAFRRASAHQRSQARAYGEAQKINRGKWKADQPAHASQKGQRVGPARVVPQRPTQSTGSRSGGTSPERTSRRARRAARPTSEGSSRSGGLRSLKSGTNSRSCSPRSPRSLASSRAASPPKSPSRSPEGRAPWRPSGRPQSPRGDLSGQWWSSPSIGRELPEERQPLGSPPSPTSKLGVQKPRQPWYSKRKAEDKPEHLEVTFGIPAAPTLGAWGVDGGALPAPQDPPTRWAPRRDLAGQMPSSPKLGEDHVFAPPARTPTLPSRQRSENAWWVDLEGSSAPLTAPDPPHFRGASPPRAVAEPIERSLVHGQPQLPRLPDAIRQGIPVIPEAPPGALSSSVSIPADLWQLRVRRADDKLLALRHSRSPSPSPRASPKWSSRPSPAFGTSDPVIPSLKIIQKYSDYFVSSPHAHSPRSSPRSTQSAGVREGWGMLNQKDGTTYAGQWVSGKRHGIGTLMFDGGIFEGQWSRGEATGGGIVRFDNGDKFEGQYVSNRKHGFGTYSWADGAVEEGQYVNGQKNDWHVWSRRGAEWRLRYEDGCVVEAIQVGKTKKEKPQCYPRAREPYPLYPTAKATKLPRPVPQKSLPKASRPPREGVAQKPREAEAAAEPLEPLGQDASSAVAPDDLMQDLQPQDLQPPTGTTMHFSVTEEMPAQFATADAEDIENRLPRMLVDRLYQQAALPQEAHQSF